MAGSVFLLINKAVNDSLEVLQFLPKGKRRRVVISLPAMVVVHPLAPALLHFAPARRVTGKITWLPSSNVNSSLRQSPNKLHKKILAYRPSKDTRPTKLKVLGGQYSTKKTGHERLMDAITTEAKGGTVVIDKSSVEKAQVILSYLREHHLIDF